MFKTSSNFAGAAKQAETVLSRWNKITTTLTTEQGKMLGIVDKLSAADSAVRQAEAEETLQGVVGTASKARKSREQVRADADTLAERLQGLRETRAKLVQDLAAAHAQLAAALPEHYEQLKAAFVEEWQRSMKTIAPIMARRQQLERILGERLQLPEATPAADVPEAAELRQPQNRLDEIAKALQTVSREASKARGASQPGGPDPYTVFELRRPQLSGRPIANLPERTKVIAGALAPGELRSLIEAGWAVPTQDAELQSAGFAASNALRTIEEEQREQRDREVAVKNAQEPGEQKSHLHERHVPTTQTHDSQPLPGSVRPDFATRLY